MTILHGVNLDLRIYFGIYSDYPSSAENLNALIKWIKEIPSFKESIKSVTQELDWVSIINSICELKNSVKLIKSEQEFCLQKLKLATAQASYDTNIQTKIQLNANNSAIKQEYSSLQSKRDIFMESF